MDNEQIELLHQEWKEAENKPLPDESGDEEFK